MMIRPLLLLLLLSLASVARLPAQHLLLGEGAVDPRVRLSLEGLPPVVGDFVGIDAEDLILTAGRRMLRIPVTRIERLEVSEGRRITPTRGAWLGLGAGSLVGVIGSVAFCRSTGDCPIGLFVPVGTAVSGLVGAGMGALVGYVAPGERWREVSPLPWRPDEPETEQRPRRRVTLLSVPLGGR